MWLLPLFALVGAVVLAASGRGTVRTPQQQLLPPGQPPGPIAVLGEFVVVGQMPPPEVILCAIAEAEALGRDDIAQNIVRAFVVPVVQAHARRRLPPPALLAEPLAAQRPALPVPAAAARALPLTVTDAEIQAALDAAPQRVAILSQRPVLEEPRQPSPLPEVPDEAWAEFLTRLEREVPTFSSSRHVGRYRQHRGRLDELGIDPQHLDAPEGQRMAIDVDLADAYQHVVDGDLLAHVGRPVTVPGSEVEPLTLSGLLGVVQCAGLEGAVGWLERPADRQRFPHTTLAFRRTNGVF